VAERQGTDMLGKAKFQFLRFLWYNGHEIDMFWRSLMKCGKLFLLSAVSFAMGALVYKAVRDNKEELDKFVDDYGDFVDDDVLEAELIEEE
jgi:hypothetical protein